MKLWQRGAEVGEHPRITDKQVANPRLHASGCPTYLHTPWKRAMSIRCHAEYYTGFPSPCPADQIKKLEFCLFQIISTFTNSKDASLTTGFI